MDREQIDLLIEAFQGIGNELRGLNDILMARTVGREGDTVTAALFQIAEAMDGVAHAIEGTQEHGTR